MSCFWIFVHCFLCFSIGFKVSNCFSPSWCNQNDPSLFYSFQYIFSYGNLKLIFIIRNTSLYLIINVFSNHNLTSKHILFINYFLRESNFGHDSYSCVLSYGLFWYKQQTIPLWNHALISVPVLWVCESLYNKPLLVNH